MIAIENISKSFGEYVLFEDAGFKINTKERIGLVGRNGHVKTTLFKMIIGAQEPDDGKIIIPKHYRIGYVQQHIQFTQKTVLEEGMRGLRSEEKACRWKVEKILAGLGFSMLDMQQDPALFSGGYQVRLNLAKVLVSEPDLLLLDEPTNYLDIVSIRWIQRFLQNWPRELILITHDRHFMDQVVTHIVGIHRHRILKLQGNTEKYYEQIARNEEIYEKTRLNDEKKRREIEQFVNRFRAKARLANMVQSRIKTLDKLGKKEKLQSLKSLDFSFNSHPLKSKTVLQAEKLHFSHDPEKKLIQDFNMVIGPRERVCIIGKNGRGKTTLLKLLAGHLQPREGTVTCPPDVRKGIFEQTHISRLVDSRTIEEEIFYTCPDVERFRVRNVCGAMMFDGDNALKKINVLSGGEKSRVMLAKLLVTPLNLLFLDEPTNHLDMDACDALLSAVDEFEGAVVMVTHNEMFLHALAERLIVFKNNTINVFEGGYQAFLNHNGWEEERSENADKGHSLTSSCDDGEKISKKEKRRMRSEIISERSKWIKPLEKSIDRIESEIEQHEKKLAEYNEAMQVLSQSGNGAEIASLSRDIHLRHAEIERLFVQYEKLTEQVEHHHQTFQEQLEQLGLE
jgi:ATP-binding cassette subfamily F protein 3